MLAAGTDEAGVDLATSVSPSSVISCPVALFNPPAPQPPAPMGKSVGNNKPCWPRYIAQTLKWMLENLAPMIARRRPMKGPILWLLRATKKREFPQFLEAKMPFCT